MLDQILPVSLAGLARQSGPLPSGASYANLNIICIMSCFVGGLGGGETMAPAAPDSASIVRLEAVQKFFGAVQALRDIDLTIGRNEIVGLIGDNGAGKSTLIKVMTGVL